MCSMSEDFAKFEVQSQQVFEHFAIKARNNLPHEGVALSARALLFKQQVLKLLVQIQLKY